ncbi:MAG: hypothetical protein ABI035_12605 [Gemmatimonadaceae bacterium]
MPRRALLLTAALLSMAACSGENITGLDQAVYNATYSGSATFQSPIANPNNSASPEPVRISMTLSQLGQNFTGTFLLADSTGQRVYAGSVTGKTTNTGADLTFVVPAPCAGTLYGSFTVADAEISGSANGRDCNSTATGGGIGITFTNLVRQ